MERNDFAYFSGMKKFVFLLVLFPKVSFCQASYFEKIFGDTTGSCYGISVVQLQQGNVLVAANFIDASTSKQEIQLFKFDNAGNELSQIHFTEPVTQGVNKMKFTPGGNLLFAGYSTDSSGNFEGMLFETDTSGNVLWRQTYGTDSTHEQLQGIDFTTAGDILSSGFTKNPAGAGNAFYLIKTNSSGNMLWQQVYPASHNAISDAVISLSGGDIFISGDRQRPNLLYTNTLVKADSAGNFMWDLEMPGQYNNGCKNDLLSSSGDILIVGESATATSFLFDPAISRIDTAGNIKWQLVYPGSNSSTDAAFDMIEPLPENFFVAGYGLNTVNNSADVFLMRIDSSGNELSRIYFGENDFDAAYSLTKSVSGNDCYITGTSVRNSLNRGYLIFTALPGLTGINEHADQEIFTVFPNPTDGEINFKTGKGKVNVTIYDSVGRELILKKYSDKNFVSLNINKRGIYFFIVIGENHFYRSGKLVVE